MACTWDSRCVWQRMWDGRRRTSSVRQWRICSPRRASGHRCFDAPPPASPSFGIEEPTPRLHLPSLRTTEADTHGACARQEGMSQKSVSKRPLWSSVSPTSRGYCTRTARVYLFRAPWWLRAQPQLARSGKPIQFQPAGCAIRTMTAVCLWSPPLTQFRGRPQTDLAGTIASHRMQRH